MISCFVNTLPALQRMIWVVATVYCSVHDLPAQQEPRPVISGPQIYLKQR